MKTVTQTTPSIINNEKLSRFGSQLNQSLIHGIEVLQGVLTSYRTADYFDILANATGAFLALVIFNIIFRKFLLI